MNLMGYHEQNERDGNSADLAMHGRLPPGSYFAPGSPKMCELRERYQALHDNDLKSSNPDQEIGIFIRY